MEDVPPKKKRHRSRRPKKVKPPTTRLRSGRQRTKSGRMVQQNPDYAGTHYGQVHPTMTSRFKPHQHYQYLANGMSNKKIRSGTLQASTLQSLEWKPDRSMLHSMDSKRAMLSMLKSCNAELETLEEWSPYALAAKAHDADTPNWNEAMSGPNAEGFWEACKIELDTLVKMNAWEEVRRQPWMNVPPSTWAFKVK